MKKRQKWKIVASEMEVGVMNWLGLARLIEISVNQSIYKRKTIIDMKIKKSVKFNGCSVCLFNKNPSLIASCYFLFRPEVHCLKQ